MIASVYRYPGFFEHLYDSSSLTQLLFLLLIVAFGFGVHQLWRTPQLTIPSVLLIGAPALLGSILATGQSFVAETVVVGNEHGLVYASGPDHYIGHIRIYLATGIEMSAFLLCLAHLRLRHFRSSERSA